MEHAHLMRLKRRGWRSCGCGNWFRRTSELSGHCEVCYEVSYDEYDYKGTCARLQWAYLHLIPEVSKFFEKKNVGVEYLKERYSIEVDHIVPKWFGIQYGIPVYELASADNLQIMSWHDNSFTGGGKGGRLPEEWFAYITGVDWVYSCDGYSSDLLCNVCFKKNVSYVKAASQLIRNNAVEIKLGDVTILRSAA